MVHHRNQHVLVLAEAEKRCPQRDLVGKIEAVARRRADGLIQPAGRPPAGVNDVPAAMIRSPLWRQYQLLRDPVWRREQGAQAFVPVDHVGQRRTERVDVEAPAQPHRGGHVVDR